MRRLDSATLACPPTAAPAHGRCPPALPDLRSNALFAMSEMALTASRKARLQVMVEAGDSGARQARSTLHDDPTKFLSVVQIGITSISILNGIVGDAAFSAPLGAAGCTRTFAHQRPRRRDHGDRAGRRHHHLPHHHLRRAGAQAHRPDVSRRRSPGSSPGRWSGSRSIARPFVRLLSWCTEATLALHRHPRRPRPQRHRGRDRRQPRGRARRRRDRGAGAPDGAQRVPPRRSPGRLDDDPARRDRLARGDGSRRRRAARHRRRRALALPGVPRRPRRRARRRSPRRSCCSSAIKGEAFARRPGPAAAGVRARDALGHGAARALPRARARRSSSSSTNTARCRA